MRRIALSFRHRQRLLMQFDLSQHSSTSLPPTSSLKRAYSPDTASLQSSSPSGPPPKLPKVSNSSKPRMRAFHSSRPYSSGGSSFRRAPKQDRFHPLYSIPQPDDPVHDLLYLQRNYDMTGLKPSWEDNPKSPLSNYCLDIGVTLPKYQTKDVLIDGKPGFRYVLLLSILILLSLCMV